MGKPAQGKTTLEPISGNTGTGMAMVAAPWVTHYGIDGAATEFMFSGLSCVWTSFLKERRKIQEEVSLDP